MMSELKVCRVHWMDCSGHPGWHTAEEIADAGLIFIQSVGWLVNETDATITLAKSVSDFRAGDLLVIPRNSIIDIMTHESD